METDQAETHCLNPGDHIALLPLYVSPCSWFTFLSSLPLPSPSFLPGWLLSPLRPLRNASRCFLYMAQPLTQTPTHSVSRTYFLSCAHKQYETHIFLTSVGSFYLTFALKSLCSEQIQEQLVSPIYCAFHKEWQTQADIRSVFTASQPCRTVSISLL